MKKRLLMVFAIVSSGLALAMEPPEFVKICMDCHGEGGVSLHQDVPTIAGASSVFLEETLFAYKDKIRPVVYSKYRSGDKSRPETNMKLIADQLDYRKIVDTAEYFSVQPFVAAKQEFDPKLAASGEKIHQNRCEKCHRNGGREPADNAGILAGQWTPYLRSAMQDLRDGRRNTDKKMKQQIADLSEADWEKLLAFYASQQD